MVQGLIALNRAWLGIAIISASMAGCFEESTILVTPQTEAPGVELRIDTYDTAIIAGEYANVSVYYGNVDPAVYSLILEIKNDTHVVSQVVSNVTAMTGTLNQRMLIDWDAPVGNNYYLSLSAVSKTGGWDDPKTIIIDRKDPLIALSVSNAPPVVTLSAPTAIVAAGDYLTLTVNHQNIDFNKFDLVVYLKNNSGAYEPVTLTPAPSGSRQVQIALPWNFTPADGYVAGWSLTSKTGGVNDPLSRSQDLASNPIKVTAATTLPPVLNVISYPQQMNAGDYADVVVDYSGIDFSTHKISVAVRNATVVAGSFELTQGASSNRPTIKVPVWWNSAIGSDYYVELAAVDIVRNSWDDPKTVVVTAKSPAISVIANPPMPQIALNSVPRTVKAGEYYRVDVQHSGINFTTHELLVYLHNRTDPTLPAIETTLQNDTDGSATLQLPVQWATAVGTQLELEWVLFSRSGGFSDLRSTSHRYEDEVITVTAPTATPPSLAFGTIDATVKAGETWNGNITYSGVDFNTHDLYVSLVNTAGLIAGATTITQPNSGSRAVSTVVSISAPAGNYTAVLAALPRNGKTLGERIADPMAAIVRAATAVVVTSDTLLPAAQISQYDTNVKAGDYLNATVAYQNIDNTKHYLVAYIAHTSGAHFEVRLNVNGSGSTTVKIPVPWTATLATDYTLGWAAVSNNGGWADARTLFAEIPNVAITIAAPTATPPQLQITSYDNSIKAGTDGRVSVTYSNVNFATHELNIDISNGADVFGRVTYNAASNLPSSGSINVTLPVDADAPASGNYYIALTAKDIVRDGWEDPKSISVVAPGVSVTP